MGRYLMMSLMLFSLSFMLTAKAVTEERSYVLAQTIVLRQDANGIDGTLQLLLDNRLSESVRQELWGKGDWSSVLSPDSKLYKEFSAQPPGKAKLRIVDSKGRLVANRDLESPLAKVEAWDPASRRNQLYLLTQDYSAGAGSYNGPGTILLQVSDAAFHDVKALNAESHKENSIRLVKSLKSDWRITMRDNKGEILSVACYPNSEGKFVIDHIRYRLDGTRWLEYKRQISGVWESDEPFPPRSTFP